LNSENDSLKIVNKEIIPEVEVVENENLKFVLKQGDYVRVKVEKHIFEKKSSLENFSEKILIVLDSQIDTRNQSFDTLSVQLMENLFLKSCGTKKNLKRSHLRS
jgi:hypothetical protein